jgi:aldehyde dehydrogenase (NAD+)
MTQVLPDIKRYRNYIAGEYVASSGPNTLPVLNPASGETWATIPDSSPADVDAAVAAARAALDGPWGALSPGKRARLLHALADAIEARGEELARVEVLDNGKLLREMSAQLKAIPGWYRYFAGLADKIHGETIPMERASLFNYTVREPVGVIACITPWNSPLFLLALKAAPALAAGNTLVIKPSEHASASTLELTACFEQAGFPPGVINVVTGNGAVAGDALVRHPGVDRVSFTGSGTAGARVAAAAVGHFADVGLELGGKSANIVFGDADLAAAVPGLLSGIFAAAGQTCVAGSRALVHRSVYDEMLRRLLERTRTIRIGDPNAPETEMGPVANEPQYRKIQEMVEIARAEGAEFAYGGARASDGELAAGLYFEPTILTGVKPQMRIAQEEVFGPVLALIPFDTDAEAIEIANATAFGLAAGIWTNNLGRAHRVARALKAGTVWVNTYRALAPSMPFGGYKTSGIGRENGLDAVRDCTQVKSVWIETEPAASDPFTIRV